ncbi:hypothetical protein [Streptomyces sp. XY152]|uniref:hypothetical protein n=1 Tax=Streptomyces sp. XY152 TaxID=1415560 RepID=UPI0006AFAF02|nr:hypothetical protein [Streptomyces sp. XY152]KOV24808.1 hypothetical protein ADK58_18120 [Streptomyces sp. XY152]
MRRRHSDRRPRTRAAGGSEDTAPYSAPDLALRLGATDPFALGPGTVVRGRGVVALTALAAERGAPGTGAYRI